MCSKEFQYRLLLMKAHISCITCFGSSTFNLCIYFVSSLNPLVDQGALHFCYLVLAYANFAQGRPHAAQEESRDGNGLPLQSLCSWQALAKLSSIGVSDHFFQKQVEFKARSHLETIWKCRKWSEVQTVFDQKLVWRQLTFEGLSVQNLKNTIDTWNVKMFWGRRGIENSFIACGVHSKRASVESNASTL